VVNAPVEIKTFMYPCAPGYSDSTGIRQAKIEIEDEFIKYIIGKGGEHKQQLLSTGAMVDLVRNANTRNMWPMSITGSDQQVEMAMSMIRSKLKKGALLNKGSLPAGFFEETRKISQWDLPWVAGKNGEGIAAISIQSGAEMDLQKAQQKGGKGMKKGKKGPDQSQMLRMIGTKDDLAKANKIIDEKLGWNSSSSGGWKGAAAWSANGESDANPDKPKTLAEAKARMGARLFEIGEPSEEYSRKLDEFITKYELSQETRNLFKIIPEEVGVTLMSGPIMTKWMTRFVMDQAKSNDEAIVQELAASPHPDARNAAMLQASLSELAEQPQGRNFLLMPSTLSA